MSSCPGPATTTTCTCASRLPADRSQVRGSPARRTGSLTQFVARSDNTGARRQLESTSCERGRCSSSSPLGRLEEAGDLNVELFNRAGPDDAGRHRLDEPRPQAAEIPGSQLGARV